MKYNKIIRFSLAVLLFCTALLESVSTPTQCVVVRGTFSPKIVLAAVNAKGKLVEVTKVSAKATDYVGTDNKHYAAHNVGYLSFKTTKSLCSNKDIPNDMVRDFALNNKLDTAKASRMGSAIATLTVLNTKKAPTETHQEPVTHATKAPVVHHDTIHTTKKPKVTRPKLTAAQIEALKNSPEAIAKRAQRAAKKAEQAQAIAVKTGKAKRTKLTPAQIEALKNSAEAQAKRAARAAKKAAAATTEKARQAAVHEEYVADVAEDEAEYSEETGYEEPTEEETEYAEAAEENDYEEDDYQEYE